jgi:16S rRNA (cytidine1402-2'-O)-methyltransferase
MNANSSGTLWIIPTPLGNLGDLTSRAVNTLKALTVVAAEDTRETRKIYSHLELPTPRTIRCDEACERRAAETIIEMLKEGTDVGFLTDAGTPCVSDPGWRLVDSVSRAGCTVIPLTGPSAVTTALSICHFPTTPFMFQGFLDRKEGRRKKEMQGMLDFPGASVFFESPHRIQRTMQELAELAPDRQCVIGREMTKKFEEYVRGTLTQVAKHVAEKKPLGEYTIVLSPGSAK